MNNLEAKSKLKQASQPLVLAVEKLRKSVVIETFKSFFTEVSLFAKFNILFFKNLFGKSFEWKEMLKQCYIIGCKSLALVGITGFIMGLVLTIQSRPTLVVFGAESWLPAMVAVSVIREIGPVVTALICAGKIGSSIGAELASMKVTEQIDAMEVSGANPFKYLVVTRVVAATIMIPILVIYSDSIALFGSYLAINLQDEISLQLFVGKVFEKLHFLDVIPSILKTFFFGSAIGLIGCYNGYYSNKGTQGVGKSANQSVVYASLLVFIIDMIAVQITSLIS